MLRFELRRRYVRMPKNLRASAPPTPGIETGLMEVEKAAVRRASEIDPTFAEFLRFYEWHYRFFTPAKVRPGLVAAYWIASRLGGEPSERAGATRGRRVRWKSQVGAERLLALVRSRLRPSERGGHGNPRVRRGGRGRAPA
jgi:hypothetical protein